MSRLLWPPGPHFLRVVIPLLMTLPFLIGCHSDRLQTWPVAGQVNFDDGTPVRTGIVEFESIEHKTTATGRIQDDGTFVLGTYDSDDGAVAGEHRVIVVQLIMNDMGIQHTTDHGHPVPPAYATYNSSGLTATVAPNEDNAITITLRTPSS